MRSAPPDRVDARAATRSRRAVARLGFVVAAVIGLLAWTWSPASAHAQLLSSSPAANSAVATGPDKIALQFDEGVDAATASITLFDKDGAPVAMGTPRAGTTSGSVEASVDATLAAGLYVVVWRTSSDDGHVVDGAFTFEVGTATASASAATALVDRVRQGIPTAVRQIDGWARLVAMLGMVVLLGAGWWSSASAPRQGEPDPDRRARVVVLAGAVAALVGTAVAFVAYGLRLRAAPLGEAFSSASLRAVIDSRTGVLYLIRLACIVACIVLVVRFGRRATSWWRAVGLVAAAVILFTFSGSGHPNASSPKAVWIGVDLAHLAAVCVWAGGLVLFATSGRGWFVPERGAVLRSFSKVATVAVPVVVVTGIAQAWRQVGTVHDLTGTAWGRYLIVKLAVAAVVIAMGAVARWMLRDVGNHSLRGSMMVEAALSVVVVGLAAGLVAVPPRQAAAAHSFHTTLTEAGYLVDVTVQPATVGTNELHVLITPPGGGLTPVTGLQARATPVDGSLPPSPIPTTSAGPNHYIGQWLVAGGGSWTLELIVASASGTTAVKTVVPITG